MTQDVIQAPQVILRLAKFLGMRQAHVTPTLNQGVQAVVVCGDTSQISAQQAEQWSGLAARDAPGVNRGVALALINPPLAPATGIAVTQPAPGRIMRVKRAQVFIHGAAAATSGMFRVLFQVCTVGDWTVLHGGGADPFNDLVTYRDFERHKITGNIFGVPVYLWQYWVTVAGFNPVGSTVQTAWMFSPEAMGAAPPISEFVWEEGIIVPPGQMLVVYNQTLFLAPGGALEVVLHGTEEDRSDISFERA